MLRMAIVFCPVLSDRVVSMGHISMRSLMRDFFGALNARMLSACKNLNTETRDRTIISDISD